MRGSINGRAETRAPEQEETSSTFSLLQDASTSQRPSPPFHPRPVFSSQFLFFILSIIIALSALYFSILAEIICLWLK